ncbi:MAG: HAD family hydrolase [Gammaproteobacteria bacterium]|nr:HAD family hydrolase [Gammaproteobacteria bacterium]
MHRIRAITLDLDNTLWEIDPVISEAERLLWEWLGKNYPRITENYAPENLLEMRAAVTKEYSDRSHDFRFLRKQALERLAVSVGYTADLVEPAFGVFDDARNRVELYPDVMPELALLSARYRVVAVTNGNANLHRIGIGHLFHGIVTSVGAGAPKPEKPIFDQAIREAGASPGEILHVGDHPVTDIEGARRAGLRTAWVNRNGDAWPGDLEPPDLEVTSMIEIRQHLESAGTRR